MKDITGKRKRKFVYLFIVIVLAVILGIFIGNLISEHIVKQNMQDYYENLASQNEGTKQESESFSEVQETQSAEEEELDILTKLGISVPEKQIDWDVLYQENSDIYAWIYIPGTNIDYPILQHPTDNEYYVNHNIDGSAGRPAVIMTQNYNTRTFLDANTLVYGHNMMNGTMFSELHNFDEEEFFQENKYIYIYLPYQVFVYEIFAEYVWSNELITIQYDFSSEEGFQKYLDKILPYGEKNGQFRDEVNLTARNHLLTLSTCTNPANDNYRYLVQGVLINDPTLTEEEIMRTI